MRFEDPVVEKVACVPCMSMTMVVPRPVIP